MAPGGYSQSCDFRHGFRDKWWSGRSLRDLYIGSMYAHIHIHAYLCADQLYTSLVSSWVLVDAAGDLSTVFETRNTVSCKKFGGDGRQCGMLVTLWWTVTVGPWNNSSRCSPERHVAKAGDSELRRYCVIRRELCMCQLSCDILTLARHCCFLAMWRGASQRVLSAHWLPNVFRSEYGENACSCCVEGRGLRAVRRDPLSANHLAGREALPDDVPLTTVLLCYREDFDDFVSNAVLCLSFSVVPLDPLGLSWINIHTNSCLHINRKIVQTAWMTKSNYIFLRTHKMGN